MHTRGRTGAAMLTAVSVTVALTATACTSATVAVRSGVVYSVAAENEYADVLSQIGGQYVQVAAIESNPNTDPHSFEASPRVAEEVSQARLLVQNGVGYDTFMKQIESASGSAHKVIDVQTLLGLPNSTPNPHLWYSPATMPAVAAAVARDLAALQPAHAAYFQARVRTFDASLDPWLAAIAALKKDFPGAPVATTEPVGDYLLQAAGLTNLTPFPLQANIMNGVDLSPQQVTFQDHLFTDHLVKVFVYNQQVVDSVTEGFLRLARRSGIPVVGVYETMPTPGFHYQSWMLAETDALHRALADRVSTERLT